MTKRWIGVLLLLVPLVSAANVTVNYATVLSQMPSPAYGANTHGLWLNDYTYVAAQSDGSLDDKSNVTYHKAMWEAAGLQVQRVDGYYDNRYIGLDQGSMESWNVTQCIHRQGQAYATNCSTQSPYNWYHGSGADDWNGTISRSAVAMQGSYSMNLSFTNGSGGVTVFQTIAPMTNEPQNLTFSAYLRSPGANAEGMIWVQRLSDSTTLCESGGGYTVIPNAWTKLNCSFTPNNSSEGFLFVIDVYAAAGKTMLVDNATITTSANTSYIRWTSSGTGQYTMLSIAQDVKYANETGGTVIVVGANLPQQIANITSDCWPDTGGCQPYKESYKEMIVSFLANITENGKYVGNVIIATKNEPELGAFYLGNIATSNVAYRTDMLSALHNWTYDAVKSYSSTIKVIGPTVLSIVTPEARSFFQHMLNKTRGKTDGVDFHGYPQTKDPCAYWPAVANNLSVDCVVNGGNCSRLYVTETNIYNDTISTGNQLLYTMAASLNYACLLTNIRNVTVVPYQWSELYNYSDSAHYPEHPERWSLLSEKILENVVYAPYNVTRQFSTYFSAGSTLVNVTSDSANVVGLSSDNGVRKYVMVINKLETNQSVKLNPLGLPSGYTHRARDVSTNTYLVADGSGWLLTLTNSSVSIVEITSVAGTHGSVESCGYILNGYERALFVTVLIAAFVAGIVMMLVSKPVSAITIIGLALGVVVYANSINALCW